MKRIGFILNGLLVAGLMFGQNIELMETTVEAPRFVKGESKQVENKKAAIYDFMQQKLEENYLLTADYVNEGIVIASFVVEPNGSVSNIKIENKVSVDLDNCVIHCIKETSGSWLPGKVNGNAVAMEQKVFVRFDVPGNLSHEQIARNYLAKAIFHYEKGMALMSIPNAKQNKTTTNFKKCEKYLSQATKYRPLEADITFWQACTYDKLGDEAKKQLKIKQHNELISNASKDMGDFAELIIMYKGK